MLILAEQGIQTLIAKQQEAHAKAEEAIGT